MILQVWTKADNYLFTTSKDLFVDFKVIAKLNGLNNEDEPYIHLISVPNLLYLMGLDLA